MTLSSFFPPSHYKYQSWWLTFTAAFHANSSGLQISYWFWKPSPCLPLLLTLFPNNGAKEPLRTHEPCIVHWLEWENLKVEFWTHCISSFQSMWLHGTRELPTQHFAYWDDVKRAAWTGEHKWNKAFLQAVILLPLQTLFLFKNNIWRYFTFLKWVTFPNNGPG